MILFRADGNPDIGSGHIMRCLSIADAGYALGEQCLFVTADEKSFSMIQEHGYENYIFNTDYKNMLSELGQMKELININHPSVIFVDSYYVTEAYLNKLWKYCQKECVLVYIDDIVSFAYPCDVLLNYNIYGPDKEKQYKELYRRKKMPEPRFLLGTGYAPLRKEFQGLPERIVKREAENILVSTGGSDPEHIAKSIAEYVTRHQECLHRFQFHFIIGNMNNDSEEIEKIAKLSDNIFLHTNVKNMGELMRQSDIAISAAGSTIYELCATQTPAITYVLADNQIPGAEAFGNKNILQSVGDVRNFGIHTLAERLIKSGVDLIEDFEKRSRIAKEQRHVVDGSGAERLLMEILVEI